MCHRGSLSFCLTPHRNVAGDRHNKFASLRAELIRLWFGMVLTCLAEVTQRIQASLKAASAETPSETGVSLQPRFSKAGKPRNRATLPSKMFARAARGMADHLLLWGLRFWKRVRNRILERTHHAFEREGCPWPIFS